MALLAMLSTAPGGERTRSWLQDRLWGSRQTAQAQQSLRRELSALRTALPASFGELVIADRDRVRLDLKHFEIDHRDRDQGAVFLEGFDIAGEDGFEEWLREERQRNFPAPAEAAETPPLPKAIVDLAKPAPGFGGKPALAILPFINASAEPDGDIWAEGMTEDLVERLSRLRWLPIIAPSTMAELSHRNLDALAIGGLIGAAYVLRGQLAQRAKTLSLNLTLLDGQTGQMLWSERLALPDGVTQLALEEVAHDLVGTLDARIDTEQQSRVINRNVEELNFNEQVWRARWHLNRLTKHDAQIARELLARALEERPNSADVLIQACFAKAWDTWSGRRDEASMREMRGLAQRAIAADNYDGRAYMLAGMAEMWLRNHENAEGLFVEALRLNPSLARAHAQLGSNYYLTGDPKSALEPLRQALRLSPLDTQNFYVLGEMAVSYLMMEQWTDAIRHADHAIARRAAYFYAHVVKVNALVRSGNLSAAKKALAKLYEAKPGFLPSDVDWLPFRERRWNDFLKQGIALAEAG